MLFLVYKIVVILLIVVVILITTIRLAYQKKIRTLSNKIDSIQNSLISSLKNEEKKELNNRSEKIFVDFKKILENTYSNHVISSQEEKTFTESLQPTFNEILSLSKRMKIFYIKPSENMIKYSEFFCKYTTL